MSIGTEYAHAEDGQNRMTEKKERSTHLARLTELVAEPGSSKEFWEDVQDEIAGLFVELHSLSGEVTNTAADELLSGLQRIFFFLEKIASIDHRQTATFYLGQVEALTELTELWRSSTLPVEAMSVLSRHKDALRIARLVAEHRALSPTTLTRAMGRLLMQPLLPLIDAMVQTGLIRRDRFGRSVVLSPTPSTQIALRLWEKSHSLKSHASVGSPALRSIEEPDTEQTEIVKWWHAEVNKPTSEPPSCAAGVLSIANSELGLRTWLSHDISEDPSYDLLHQPVASPSSSHPHSPKEAAKRETAKASAA